MLTHRAPKKRGGDRGRGNDAKPKGDKTGYSGKGYGKSKGGEKGGKAPPAREVQLDEFERPANRKGDKGREKGARLDAGKGPPDQGYADRRTPDYGGRGGRKPSRFVSRASDSPELGKILARYLGIPWV